VFFRSTGFTTAYVGSSNLSNAALTSGLEWNTKVTKRDLPETIDKIAATFEYYWNDREFEYYAEDQRERLARALQAEKYYDANNPELYTMDIAPYSYQQEILDRLEAERTVRGYTRNLVVAATGTGKTVISALDYKRFRKQNPGKPCRLLFVAHREEILKQSLYTFRAVLKDANFGELFVGSYKPESVDNLFLSIQTFNSQSFTDKTAPDFYDYIVVDEFHHAAAPATKSCWNTTSRKSCWGSPPRRNAWTARASCRTSATASRRKFVCPRPLTESSCARSNTSVSRTTLIWTPCAGAPAVTTRRSFPTSTPSPVPPQAAARIWWSPLCSNTSPTLTRSRAWASA
jgi:hypothetical protein